MQIANCKRQIDDRPLPTNPQSLIPNPSSRGFTLIEMLIVITIMLILVGAAATAMRPATEGRRIREAARAINVYLSSARNRAMETGRPCGVTFHHFHNPAAGTTTFGDLTPLERRPM